MLKRTANCLVGSFVETLRDCFNKEHEARFVSYFISVLMRVCSVKCIMGEVQEKELHEMIDLLLRNLTSVDKAP